MNVPIYILIIKTTSFKSKIWTYACDKKGEGFFFYPCKCPCKCPSRRILKEMISYDQVEKIKKTPVKTGVF
ncbi:hypothetical protein C1637_18465 [Chryseobacterium lactis]|uniref:Uncharacterized protein n=1 Tax=Chryseobacterium lactis TaxID=1241981 RepID=A0A3G6RJY9_CHRLC|nr:hypothetical protein EG342_23970 [Chryseobacterium lactis]AZB05155.1 hypothetical protein EG341_14850 [Chryseobacterium lactis]PNW12137.1 hypothetical protein C1637_18465 [Chryseobacterium lactis]